MQPVEMVDTPGPIGSTEDAATELEKVKQELESTRDQMLRALADFDNYRRRIEREADSIGRAGKRELIVGLIEVSDAFDQAYQMSGDDRMALEGLQVIHRQLLRLLEAHEVVPFDSVGDVFDPEWHEAINTTNAEAVGAEPGQITLEFQKGYRWGDKLLRPARVQVAQ
jgi:molecular chaperone GrpE